MIRSYALVFAVIAAWWPVLAASGPARAESVEIVVSADAAELEQFAAAELQRYLARLFNVASRIVPLPGETSDCVFFLGTSKGSIGGTLGAETFPPLSDQGFVLRSMKWKSKSVMAIVGGSPVATMWAVYELVEQYGDDQRGDVGGDSAGYHL